RSKRFPLRPSWRHLMPDAMRDERESLAVQPAGWPRTKVRLQRMFFALFIAVVLVPLRLVRRAIHRVWWPLRVRVLRPIKRSIFGRRPDIDALRSGDE
ncbi:MAG: hypothetical protein ACK58T_00375, partial [Phycisphaerae bacterium]